MPVDCTLVNGHSDKYCVTCGLLTVALKRRRLFGQAGSADPARDQCSLCGFQCGVTVRNDEAGWSDGLQRRAELFGWTVHYV